jgi:hypothetical protein
MLLTHYIVIILLIIIIIVPVNVLIMNKNDINSIYLLYWYDYIILNMDIRLFLDPITMEKIRDAVKSGKYDDEYEFIFEAIHEKLNQSDSKQSETLLEIVDEGTSDAEWVEIGDSEKKRDEFRDGVSVHSLSDKSLETLERLILENQTDTKKFSQGEIYGPGSAGLIWIFHNRFFPVKIVVNIIAHIMVRENRPWLNLDEFSDEILDTIEQFVSEIQGNKSLDPSVHQGFPVPENTLFKRYEKMQKERPKAFRSNIRGFRGSVDDKIKQLVSSRLTSSRLRFSAQFIGKSLMKDNGLVYSGACFEMGLLAAKGDRKNLEITLSKKGLEFTMLKNPVIGNVAYEEDLESKEHNNTFSTEELDFIQKEIIEKYELENNIIAKILNMRKTIPDKDQTEITKKIREIFEEEKRQYLLQKFPDIIAKIHSSPDDDVIQWRVAEIMRERGTLKGKARDTLWQQLSSDVEQNGIPQEQAVKYLVEKHIQFQINATMSRIKELDDVNQNQ